MFEPRSWQRTTIGQHAQVRARIGWRGLSSSEYTSDGPYLIAGNHISGGHVNWPQCDHISIKRYEESWEIALRPGDVILTKDGTIGRVAVLDALPGRATINGTMMLVRPQSSLDPHFLYHYLTGRSFQRLVADKISGSSIPHIFQRDMVGLDVLLPPLAEQRRIADILDIADAAIQQTEALIAKLKLMRAGLLHDLLTLGLDERGELRDPVAHPELFKETPLGVFPKGWAITTLVDHVDLPTGQIDPQRSPYCDWPLIAPDHIESGTGRLLEVETAHEQQAISGKYGFLPGDVLYSKIRPYLRKAILAQFSGLCSADMYPLRPHPDLVPSFLLAVILGERFSHFAEAVSMRSGFPKINREELAEYELCMPSYEEQAQIAATLDRCDARVRAEEAYRDKLKLLKQGLMDDLLTGRVRVPVEEGVTA